MEISKFPDEMEVLWGRRGNFEVEITKENEKEQFVNMGIGRGMAGISTSLTMCALPYGGEEARVKNRDLVNLLNTRELYIASGNKKKPMLKTIGDFYSYLSTHPWVKPFINPRLVCKAIKERIEASKRQLAKSTPQSLNKWQIYIFRKGKWHKTPEVIRTLKTAFGLWGIDSQGEMDVLLEDCLVVKKQKNPLESSFGE